MEARSRMNPQYVQYIQYRSVLNAGHALIKTMCIETISAYGNITFTTDPSFTFRKNFKVNQRDGACFFDVAINLYGYFHKFSSTDTSSEIVAFDDM